VKIWIDLSNSPHALLFEPIVRMLRERGHTVELTARENAQTVELARSRWPEVEVIGGESPRGRVAKAAALGKRVTELRRWCRARRPDVAVSHNSYAQIVAASARRVPAVTAMDFEHQPANHLAFRLARTVLLPEAMRGLDLARNGATAGKVRFYPGLKEEVYLGDFEPDAHVVEKLGIDDGPGSVLIMARTPPSRALYHASDNPVFIRALRTVAAVPRACVVVLARHPEQRAALEQLNLANLIVPSAAVDSRSLMYAADLVIGAGGTMTREAALLGTPTVTMFAGRPPAVDLWLERRGRLRRVTSADQLRPLARPGTAAHDPQHLRRRSELLVEHFVAAATMSELQPSPPTDTRSTPAGSVVA
jgi:predicted glycosyltransferase